jgi:anthranilate 1,2-dioxygenase small subunit
LQERYVGVIDTGRLEQWPDLFTEDSVYEILPKENADHGLPMGIMHCFGRAMLQDRVTSLRKANVFEVHTYRHLTSRLEITPIDANTVEMQSNYVVIQTLTDGESRNISSRSIPRPRCTDRRRLALLTQEGGLRHFTRANLACDAGLIKS